MSLYPSGINKFSNSEINTWQDCRRKWMLQYFMSLAQKAPEHKFPLDTGNLIHGAFEQLYLNGGVADPVAVKTGTLYLSDMRAAQLEEFADQDDTANLATVLRAHKAADASYDSYCYWALGQGLDLNLRILGAEDKLAVAGPIPNTELNGRIDLLAEDTRNGDIVVIDLKSVGSIEAKMKMLHMDTQAKTYALLARSKWPDRNVRVSFRVVKQNMRTAAVKGVQEAEVSIHLNQGQLDVYWEQLGGIMQDIINVQTRLANDESHQVVAYPSPSSECSWKCPFFAVCPMLDDPHTDADWALENLYESKFINRPRTEDLLEGLLIKS